MLLGRKASGRGNGVAFHKLRSGQKGGISMVPKYRIVPISHYGSASLHLAVFSLVFLALFLNPWPLSAADCREEAKSYYHQAEVLKTTNPTW